MAERPTTLQPNASLAEIQGYIASMCEQRGFSDESLADSFIMLTEEVGELAKSLRPLRGVTIADDSQKREAGHEAADVFWMLMCVCNKLDIDLEAAFRSKEEKNATRVWR